MWLLPFPYNHPARPVEAAAIIDVLPKGRLEFDAEAFPQQVEAQVAIAIGPKPRATPVFIGGCCPEQIAGSLFGTLPAYGGDIGH